ncbi:hypothetical protein Shyhy01_20640 [Streptomyces hygroscopicus subsp. hygroscopicus]|uniref:hypothetical protein n=1 Tax=Streptomyces sp. KHY 26 TaxID=3097359 RepID=UPI0024A154DB|nr:hypothetical protein [Streptomyces hygroscopicus]GLX49114.1 hypothetical protein Shyhy01_20640 [Streptomyces hygroscopicus subsp. hygroscopicus]
MTTRSPRSVARVSGLVAALARAVLGAAAGAGRPPTPVQRFAARRPVLLAVYAGTPIGLVLVLAAWPRLHTTADIVFILANCVLVYCVFALVAYGERARQRLLGRNRHAPKGTDGPTRH